MYSSKTFLNAALLFIATLIIPVSVFATQVVDINQADAATMIENWKGIGEKKARAIVSYRKSNGPFKSIDDLANVKGIGEGIIKNNRKYMSTTKGVYKATGKKQSSTKDKKTSSSDKQKTAISSSDKKSTSKKSSKKSSDKSSTSKSSKTKKSTSKTSKKDKCKPGSKGCPAKKDKKKSKKKKKNSTT